jgi:hypothetical protein
VLVVPSKKQSTTSANVWVSLTGTLGETKPIELPRGSNQMIFEYRNLGVLSSMSIGHDNSGISPNWHVDHVLVRNEVTGHTFFFPCGRWLGRYVAAAESSNQPLLLNASFVFLRIFFCVLMPYYSLRSSLLLVSRER